MTLLLGLAGATLVAALSALPGQLAQLGLLGVPLLLWAWWRLRGAPARSVLLAAGVWSLPLLVAPPLFTRDVYAYAAQAHLVRLGIDPYTHPPADVPGPLLRHMDPGWAHTRSPYGPVFLRLAALVLPGQHPYAAVLVLRLLAVLGVVLLAWGVARLSADPAAGLWLGIANPLVLLHLVGGAHNEALMAGLMVVGVALAPVSLVAAAALVTAGALVKLPAVIALAFLPFLGRRGWLRGLLPVAASAAVTGVVLTLAAGLGWGWVRTLNAGEARRSLMSVTTGAGALVGSVRAGQLLGLAVAAVVVAVLLWRARAIGPVRALGLALLVVAALGPVVQPWYLLWGLPLLAATAGPRLATGLAVACSVLCLLVLPSGRHVIRPPLYGVPALLVAGAGYYAARRTTAAGRIPA